MIDQYKKGKRIYTHWDKKSEQVTVPSKKPPKKNIPSAIEIALPIPEARWANESVVFYREEECIVDFINATATKRRVVSRVIMSPQTAKKFMKLLQEKV